MVDIFRTDNPEVVRHLAPFFKKEEDDRKRDWKARNVERIVIGLTQNYENVFVGLACDEDQILGYLYGYIPHNRDYAWIEEFEFFTHVDKKYVIQLLDLFEDFVRSRGKKYIQASSNRAKALMRRFNYYEVGTIIEKEI